MAMQKFLVRLSDARGVMRWAAIVSIPVVEDFTGADAQKAITAALNEISVFCADNCPSGLAALVYSGMTWRPLRAAGNILPTAAYTEYRERVARVRDPESDVAAGYVDALFDVHQLMSALFSEE